MHSGGSASPSIHRDFALHYNGGITKVTADCTHTKTLAELLSQTLFASTPGLGGDAGGVATPKRREALLRDLESRYVCVSSKALPVSLSLATQLAPSELYFTARDASDDVLIGAEAAPSSAATTTTARGGRGGRGRGRGGGRGRRGGGASGAAANLEMIDIDEDQRGGSSTVGTHDSQEDAFDGVESSVDDEDDEDDEDEEDEEEDAEDDDGSEDATVSSSELDEDYDEDDEVAPRRGRGRGRGAGRGRGRGRGRGAAAAGSTVTGAKGRTGAGRTAAKASIPSTATSSTAATPPMEVAVKRKRGRPPKNTPKVSTIPSTSLSSSPPQSSAAPVTRRRKLESSAKDVDAANTTTAALSAQGSLGSSSPRATPPPQPLHSLLESRSSFPPSLVSSMALSTSDSAIQPEGSANSADASASDVVAVGAAAAGLSAAARTPTIDMHRRMTEAIEMLQEAQRQQEILEEAERQRNRVVVTFNRYVFASSADAATATAMDGQESRTIGYHNVLEGEENSEEAASGEKEEGGDEAWAGVRVDPQISSRKVVGFGYGEANWRGDECRVNAEKEEEEDVLVGQLLRGSEANADKKHIGGQEEGLGFVSATAAWSHRAPPLRAAVILDRLLAKVEAEHPASSPARAAAAAWCQEGRSPSFLLSHPQAFQLLPELSVYAPRQLPRGRVDKKALALPSHDSSGAFKQEMVEDEEESTLGATSSGGATVGRKDTEFTRYDGQSVTVPIVVGGCVQLINPESKERSHRWTVYVRGLYNGHPSSCCRASTQVSVDSATGLNGGDSSMSSIPAAEEGEMEAEEDYLSEFVESVTFILDRSFNPCVRTVDKAPFELTEVGWGEFVVSIHVHLKYRGCAGAAQKMKHTLRRYFCSSSGRAALLTSTGPGRGASFLDPITSMNVTNTLCGRGLQVNAITNADNALVNSLLDINSNSAARSLFYRGPCLPPHLVSCSSDDEDPIDDDSDDDDDTGACGGSNFDSGRAAQQRVKKEEPVADAGRGSGAASVKLEEQSSSRGNSVPCSREGSATPWQSSLQIADGPGSASAAAAMVVVLPKVATASHSSPSVSPPPEAALSLIGATAAMPVVASPVRRGPGRRPSRPTTPAVQGVTAGGFPVEPRSPAEAGGERGKRIVASLHIGHKDNVVVLSHLLRFSHRQKLPPAIPPDGGDPRTQARSVEQLGYTIVAEPVVTESYDEIVIPLKDYAVAPLSRHDLKRSPCRHRHGSQEGEGGDGGLAADGTSEDINSSAYGKKSRSAGVPDTSVKPEARDAAVDAGCDVRGPTLHDSTEASPFSWLATDRDDCELLSAVARLEARLRRCARAYVIDSTHGYTPCATSSAPSYNASGASRKVSLASTTPPLTLPLQYVAGRPGGVSCWPQIVSHGAAATRDAIYALSYVGSVASTALAEGWLETALEANRNALFNHGTSSTATVAQADAGDRPLLNTETERRGGTSRADGIQQQQQQQMGVEVYSHHQPLTIVEFDIAAQLMRCAASAEARTLLVETVLPHAEALGAAVLAVLTKLPGWSSTTAVSFSLLLPNSVPVFLNNMPGAHSENDYGDGDSDVYSGVAAASPAMGTSSSVSHFPSGTKAAVKASAAAAALLQTGDVERLLRMKEALVREIDAMRVVAAQRQAAMTQRQI